MTLNVPCNIMKLPLVIVYSFSHAHTGRILKQEQHINNTRTDRVTYNFLLKSTHKSCRQISDNQHLQLYFICFEMLTLSNDSQSGLLGLSCISTTTVTDDRFYSDLIVGNAQFLRFSFLAVTYTLDRHQLQGNFQRLLFNFVVLHSYILRRLYICNTHNSNKMALQSSLLFPLLSIPDSGHFHQSYDPLCQFTDSALSQSLFTSVLAAVIENK